MQVGNAFEKNKTYHELKLIASDPDDRYAFKVTNYTALDGLLSKLQQTIIQMEGGGSRSIPLSIWEEARLCTPASLLSYPHMALWATPTTSLSLSYSISKKATVFSGPLLPQNSLKL